MWSKKAQSLVIFSLTGMLVSTSGCSLLLSEGIALPEFTPEWVNDLSRNGSLAQPYDANRYTTFSDGNLQVMQGASCTSAESAVVRDNADNLIIGLRVNDSVVKPARYDKGTVFLNGWRLVYQNSDHHVDGLTTAILDIEDSGGELSWTAGGALFDANGDDGYTWCYHYTILLWKDGILNLRADVEDSDADNSLTYLSMDTPGSTALQSVVNFHDGLSGPAQALLPRGFGAASLEGDKHLLQFALKHGDVNAFVDADDASHGAYWSFESVLKDKHRRFDVAAAQMVSIMSGPSVHVINPDFTIVARDPLGANVGPSGLFTDTVVVDDVPFDYAVPMLTGWDLASAQSDRHIKDIGAWIESFDYTKDPQADKGILTYTIKGVFEDKGGNDITHSPRYQVSILGLDRSEVVTTRPGNTPLSTEAPSTTPPGLTMNLPVSVFTSATPIEP